MERKLAMRRAAKGESTHKAKRVLRTHEGFLLPAWRVQLSENAEADKVINMAKVREMLRGRFSFMLIGLSKLICNFLHLRNSLFQYCHYCIFRQS